MNGTPLPPKKEVALALLERGSVHVHLDPRATGVMVPAWFKRQAQLVLQVGLNMPVPIPDLRVDEDGLSCTLSFNRSPFFCIVPWSSVYAMVGDDGRGMVWPEDVPPEVALQARSREAEPAAKPPAAKRALAAVKAVETPRPPSRGASASTGQKPRAVRAAADPNTKPARKSRAKKAPADGTAIAEKADAAAGRGVLTAVPSATPTGKPARPAATPARPAVVAHKDSQPKTPEPPRKEEPKPTPQAPSPAPSPARKPAAGKTKREIPPYLRVVK